MLDSSKVLRDSSFGVKSRTSTGRSRANRKLVEISVFLPAELFQELKVRAEWYDRSISAQVRSDVLNCSRLDKPREP